LRVYREEGEGSGGELFGRNFNLPEGRYREVSYEEV